jgi:hypothetical protein
MVLTPEQSDGMSCRCLTKGQPPEDAETQPHTLGRVWDPLFHFSDKHSKCFKDAFKTMRFFFEKKKLYGAFRRQIINLPHVMINYRCPPLGSGKCRKEARSLLSCQKMTMKMYPAAFTIVRWLTRIFLW